MILGYLALSYHLEGKDSEKWLEAFLGCSQHPMFIFI